MGERVCSACGAEVPERGRFCPSCGAAVAAGGVPVLDLSPDAPTTPRVDDPPPDRSLVTAVAVVLGLVAVVVLLSLATDDDDDGGTRADEPTSTTLPRVTATTLASPASDPGSILASGERLIPGFGMALVSIRSNGSVAVADLAAGTERVLEERIPLEPVRSASWTGTTFVVRSVGDELHRLVPGTVDEWEAIDTHGFVADPYWPGPPGIFYLWDPNSPNASTMRFGLVGSTGPVRLLDGPGSVYFGAPVGFVGDSAVFNSPDGIYLLGPDQQPRRLDHGFALGAADDRVVRRRCDEHLECRLLLDRPLVGEVADMGPVDPAASIQRVLPSPDGAAVAVVAHAGDELTIRVLPVPAGRTLTWVVGQRWSEPHMLQWSSDGDGVVWFDTEHREVRSVRWRGGELSTEPASARLQELPITASFEAIFLIPLADLPPGWAPSGPPP